MGESNSNDKTQKRSFKGREICIPKTSAEVRVVHILSPPVVKTSVTDFKDVVQKLTGKEESSVQSQKNVKPVLSINTHYYQSQEIHCSASEVEDLFHDELHYPVPSCDESHGPLGGCAHPGFIKN
ncbi:hypothetical protein SUGI_0315440 [Cryptomeria japonica]|nr:hypothetical protein SUGI_0315440 [Cryptomeria japonica]